MTRKSVFYHRDMLASFARLMKMRKPPDVEAFKIRIPADPSPREDADSRRRRLLAEIKKSEEDQ
jgi:hypothetical protein